MNRSLFSVRKKWAVVALIFVVVCLAFSDEWKARHALISPNGVMNLSEPPAPEEIFFPGPSGNADAWLAGLKAWRADRVIRLRYDGSQYARPDLAWTQRIFSQVQLLIWDRTFYNPETGKYTVDRFLADTENRIGPIDAVLIWHVYPNLGVDDRNQFDLLRDLPGGVPALREMVEKFHRHGVRVFFPIIAWDTGTRDEDALPWVAISQLLKDIGADGINFDTLESIPAQFRSASDATRHPLALEPQFDIRDESIAWANLGWNDWVTWEGKEYPFMPMVSKSKWFEPRHMVNVTDRFTRDKTDSLQHAFFNGQGYATLENLWGFWYGTTPHDAEAIRRFTRIERDLADDLDSPDWQPHSPTLQPGIFASRFPTAASTLWTVVNRNEYDVIGEQIRTDHHAGMHYYDLWRGVELRPALHGNQATLTFEIEGLGFGAILATGQDLTAGPLKELLSYMADRSRLPLSRYSREWKPLAQKMVEIPATKLAQSAPSGMIRVPGGDYDFQVRGIEIEGGNDPGVDVQYPWEDVARRSHRHRIQVSSFYIDRTPVTNAEFKTFLDATHYQPKDSHNFLRDWTGGAYPDGWEKRPVTWVSIEDARAYAAWAGKRLPHEWEWQLAAQANDGRIYPWGNEWNPENLPAADRGHTMRALVNVDAFPQGASAIGALDMEGNVSQWTDEYRDEHTRAAIIRGGASYQPLGSIWYFPQTYRLDEHQKYLLMSPGRDRAGTIGFRCVVDAQ
ncbi:MAG TPA: formylglycine-generating enzyme family protein [Terriglobales bacterium]|jgi:formylglycine-generating enzyme required for sulfatase activity|nr:formylglycine-generating enzyme family protein [Terriglobales bacterium]